MKLTEETQISTGDVSIKCIFDGCKSTFGKRLRATEHIAEAVCSQGQYLKRNDPTQFYKMVTEYKNKVAEEATQLKKRQVKLQKLWTHARANQEPSVATDSRNIGRRLSIRHIYGNN